MIPPLLRRLSFFSFFSFEKSRKTRNKLMFNLILQAMQNFIIKTHKANKMYLGEHFFILCKGKNSGKPLFEPCANCWVILFPNKQERENHYWMAYTLWQSKFWHYFLVGSIIPFLRLFEFKKEFLPKTKMLQSDYEKHLNNVLALQLLQDKEQAYQKKLFLIRDMKKIILQRYAQY